MPIARKVGSQIRNTVKICRVLNGVPAEITQVDTVENGVVTNRFTAATPAGPVITSFAYNGIVDGLPQFTVTTDIVGGDWSIILTRADGTNQSSSTTDWNATTRTWGINFSNFQEQDVTYSIVATGDTTIGIGVDTSIIVPFGAVDGLRTSTVAANTAVLAANNRNTTRFTLAGFQYGTTSALGQESDFMGSFGQDGLFTVQITSLQPETEYHYRAFVSDGEDEFFTEILTFTTSEAPTGSTDIITGSSIDVDGLLTVTTGDNGFVYYLGLQQTGGTTFDINDKDSDGNVSIDLWGSTSTPLTRFAYIGVEVDDDTAVNDGTQLPIFQRNMGTQPADGSIIITHLVPQPVGTTSATLRGAIEQGLGGLGTPATSANFYWLIDSTDRDASYIVANGTAENVFSDLTNGFGSISEDITFSSSTSVRQLQVVIRANTTNSIVQRASIPAQTVAFTVTTNAASDIRTTRFSLNGSYSLATGQSIVSAGFIFGSSASAVDLGINASGNPIGTGVTRHLDSTPASPFSAIVDNLDPSTTYYFRAIAQDGNGWIIGSRVSQATSAVTYSVQWINNGSQFRNQLSVVETSACNASTDSTTCATDQITCPSTGTRGVDITFSNNIQPEVLRCVGTDGSTDQASQCTFTGGQFNGQTRNRDTGSGASTDASTVGCTIQVTNDAYVEPETYEIQRRSVPGSQAGGQVTVTSATPCAANSAARPTCATDLLNCSVPGMTTETFNQTAITQSEVQVCVNTSSGAEVNFAFCSVGEPETFDDIEIQAAQTGATRQASCSFVYPNEEYEAPTPALTVDITGGSSTIAATATTSAFGATIGGTATGNIVYAWTISPGATVNSPTGTTTTVTAGSTGGFTVTLTLTVTRGGNTASDTNSIFIQSGGLP